MIRRVKGRKRFVSKLLGYGGGTPFTGSLESIDEEIRRQILRKVELQEGEEVLLASFFSTESWCLATTERLLLGQSDGTVSLSWEEVQAVGPRPDDWIDLFRGARLRNTIEDLVVLDSHGVEYHLRLERGSGFDLVWDLLDRLSLRGSGPLFPTERFRELQEELRRARGHTGSDG
jgi:hypothetical protein